MAEGGNVDTTSLLDNTSSWTHTKMTRQVVSHRMDLEGFFDSGALQYQSRFSTGEPPYQFTFRLHPGSEQWNDTSMLYMQLQMNTTLHMNRRVLLGGPNSLNPNIKVFNDLKQMCDFGVEPPMVELDWFAICFNLRDFKAFIGTGDKFSVVISVDLWSEYNFKGTVTQPSFLKETRGRVACDLGVLFQNQAHSDLTITCFDGTFPVHRNILAARSRFFAAMLSTDTQEMLQGVISFPNIEAAVLKIILVFIYTGSCDSLGYLARGVLVQADYFCLPALLALAQSAILREISLESACELYSFANTHNASLLRGAAHQFIINHLPAIRNTEGWSALAKTPLVFDMLASSETDSFVVTGQNSVREVVEGQQDLPSDNSLEWLI